LARRCAVLAGGGSLNVAWVVRCVGSNAEVYSPKIRFRSLDHAKVWARAFVRFAPPEQWLTVLIEGPGTLIRWRIRPPGT
jgi:hypothetical protein